MTEKNEQIYKDIQAGVFTLEPSYMGIIPSDQDFKLSKTYLENVIKNNNEFDLQYINERDIDGKSSFELIIKYNDELFTSLVILNENNPEYLQSLSFANKVDGKYIQPALDAKYYVDLSLQFNDNPLFSFFFQLKLMNTIVPDACMGIDFSAMTVFSPDWLKMLIEANIAPSPKYLYTIHAVYDGDEKNRIYWLHTHGLLRCGSMELEVVNLKNGPQEIFSLINYTAGLFIENHYKEKDTFTAGYDGLNINLAWIRWEEALQQFPKNILGGLDSRQDEKDAHAGPSGILFAVEENNFVSPEIYASTLADNPIIFISSTETARMRMLALSQLDIFKKTFQHYHKHEKKGFLSQFLNSKEESSSWSFLVKLGFLVDKAETEEDKEHLWFEVISLDGDQITVKLINEPYWIAKLKEGEIYTYPLKEVLTDWIIYAPDTSYTPDQAYLLSEQL